MKRRIIKFQNGGFIPQVYNTQQVNPVFLDGNMNQLIQTASMPMESGLQGYMGLQQLDIQRDQEKRAKEEFKYKIKAYDRAELDATLKQMNTLRDDFINLDLLPADAQRYSEITSQYVPEDIKRRAMSGDINAMKELYMGYNSVMMHPEVKQMLIRKKTNDKNTEIFTKNKDLLDYMTNSSEIMQAITSGAPMPSIQLDSERYKRDQEIARTYKQNLDKARALELDARTNALQQDIEDKNIARESLRNIAANELGIGNIPYDQQSPENKAKISAKSWELENADLIAKYKSAPTALAKQQLALQIEQSKMNRVNELISDGVTPEKAFNVVYGEQEKTKSESDYEYFSRQMRSDHPGIAEEEVRAKYNEKTSNVNYNYENVGSGGRKREDGNIERQDYTIVNKDGETIGFKLNGQDKFTDDFPSSKFSFKGGILSIEGDLNNTELSYLKQLFLNETFKTLEDLKDIPGAVWENPFFSNSILRLNVAEYNKSKISTQSNPISTSNPSSKGKPQRPIPTALPGGLPDKGNNR